jgi:hypothetical protein
VFECAQAEYVAEGVPWTMVEYHNNDDVLELIEGKLGVLSLLNEQCMMPKVRRAASVPVRGVRREGTGVPTLVVAVRAGRGRLVRATAVYAQGVAPVPRRDAREVHSGT